MTRRETPSVEEGSSEAEEGEEKSALRHGVAKSKSAEAADLLVPQSARRRANSLQS